MDNSSAIDLIQCLNNVPANARLIELATSDTDEEPNMMTFRSEDVEDDLTTENNHG